MDDINDGQAVFFQTVVHDPAPFKDKVTQASETAPLAGGYIHGNRRTRSIRSSAVRRWRSVSDARATIAWFVHRTLLTRAGASGSA